MAWESERGPPPLGGEGQRGEGQGESANPGYSEYLCLAIRYQGIDRIDPEGVLAAVRQDPAAAKCVASLDLCGNEIEDLEGLSGYSYLVSLSLARNRVVSLGAADFPFTLTHLDVSHNGLTSLDGVQGLPFLTWLDASHNQIASAAELSQCYRLRTALLGHNALASVAGLEGLLDLDRLQLHGNAVGAPAELRLLATFAKLRHLTLRGNPLAERKPYLRLEITHLMPTLVSLDGQPLRAGPATPRGGSGISIAASQRRSPPSVKPAGAASRDPYAAFGAVFKAPLFDPPGGGGAGEDPVLDVDYAPDDAVAWLRTVISDVARTFDLDVVDLDRPDASVLAGVAGGATDVSGMSASFLGGAGGGRAGADGALTPSRRGLFGYLVPGSPEHQAAVVAESQTPRSLWNPPRPEAPAPPPTPGTARTEESVGFHIARMQVGRQREEAASVTKSLRDWQFRSPADSSTLLKIRFHGDHDVSGRVDHSWADDAPPTSPGRGARRDGHAEERHLERMRQAAEAEAAVAGRGLALPGGFERKQPGQVLGSPPRGRPGAAGLLGKRPSQRGSRNAHVVRMRARQAEEEEAARRARGLAGGFSRKGLGEVMVGSGARPTERDAEAMARAANRLAWGTELHREEVAGRPLPGYKSPQHLARAFAELGLSDPHPAGSPRGAAARDAAARDAAARELAPNSIPLRAEKRLAEEGSPVSPPRRTGSGAFGSGALGSGALASFGSLGTPLRAGGPGAAARQPSAGDFQFPAVPRDAAGGAAGDARDHEMSGVTEVDAASFVGMLEQVVAHQKDAASPRPASSVGAMEDLLKQTLMGR